MNRGYIKLWRKTEDSGLLQMHSTFSMFVYMLMEAAYKPTRFGTVDLERGQLSSGRNKLSKALNLSEQQVRTCLEKLHNLNMITSESTKLYTVYTIVNYSIYQDSDISINQEDNQRATNEQPTCNQRATTNKEAKHSIIKEVKKINNNYLPPISEELLVAWTKIRKLKKSGEVTEIVYKALVRESNKAGLSIDEAVTVCCERGWAGFQSDWYLKSPKINGTGYKTADQQRNENMDKAVASFLGESNNEVIDV